MFQIKKNPNKPVHHQKKNILNSETMFYVGEKYQTS